MADQASAVKAAQSVLAKAQDFTKSVEGTPKSRFALKPPVVRKAPPPVVPKGPTVRAQNTAVANEEAAKYGMHGVPIMHKGGKVKKDGPVILKKGETVRTPEQEKKVQDKMSKAKEAMTKDEKKPKSEKKDGKKKKHVHKIEVEKKKGGYLVRTHSKPAPGAEPNVVTEGPEESVHPDLASVTDHLNQNMGPDEEAPEAAAPPPAAPQE